MSDSESAPQSQNPLRRLRDDALQLGPRKKAQDTSYLVIAILTDGPQLTVDALQIHSSTMADTLVARYMRCAVCSQSL